MRITYAGPRLKMQKNKALTLRLAPFQFCLLKQLRFSNNVY
jgi:hypothetical protein